MKRAGRRVRGAEGSRRDALEPEIVRALQQCGASVTLLSMPGLPDLLIGHRRKTYLAEVKSDKGTLTPSQLIWHDRWRGGEVAIVRSVDDALRLIGVIA